MNFGKFQEHLFLQKTSASVYFCISFFNNLDDTATYSDEEDGKLRDKSDNEFSCSDDGSELKCY